MNICPDTYSIKFIDDSGRLKRYRRKSRPLYAALGLADYGWIVAKTQKRAIATCLKHRGLSQYELKRYVRLWIARNHLDLVRSKRLSVSSRDLVDEITDDPKGFLLSPSHNSFKRASHKSTKSLTAIKSSNSGHRIVASQSNRDASHHQNANNNKNTMNQQEAFSAAPGVLSSTQVRPILISNSITNSHLNRSNVLLTAVIDSHNPNMMMQHKDKNFQHGETSSPPHPQGSVLSPPIRDPSTLVPHVPTGSHARSASLPPHASLLPSLSRPPMALSASSQQAILSGHQPPFARTTIAGEPEMVSSATRHLPQDFLHSGNTKTGSSFRVYHHPIVFDPWTSSLATSDLNAQNAAAAAANLLLNTNTVRSLPPGTSNFFGSISPIPANLESHAVHGLLSPPVLIGKPSVPPLILSSGNLSGKLVPPGHDGGRSSLMSPTPSIKALDLAVTTNLDEPFSAIVSSITAQTSAANLANLASTQSGHSRGLSRWKGKFSSSSHKKVNTVSGGVSFASTSYVNGGGVTNNPQNGIHHAATPGPIITSLANNSASNLPSGASPNPSRDPMHPPVSSAAIQAAFASNLASLSSNSLPVNNNSNNNIINAANSTGQFNLSSSNPTSSYNVNNQTVAAAAAVNFNHTPQPSLAVPSHHNSNNTSFTAAQHLSPHMSRTAPYDIFAPEPLFVRVATRDENAALCFRKRFREEIKAKHRVFLCAPGEIAMNLNDHLSSLELGPGGAWRRKRAFAQYQAELRTRRATGAPPPPPMDGFDFTKSTDFEDGIDLFGWHFTGRFPDGLPEVEYRKSGVRIAFSPTELIMNAFTALHLAFDSRAPTEVNCAVDDELANAKKESAKQYAAAVRAELRTRIAKEATLIHETRLQKFYIQQQQQAALLAAQSDSKARSRHGQTASVVRGWLQKAFHPFSNKQGAAAGTTPFTQPSPLPSIKNTPATAYRSDGPPGTVNAPPNESSPSFVNAQTGSGGGAFHSILPHGLPSHPPSSQPSNEQQQVSANLPSLPPPFAIPDPQIFVPLHENGPPLHPPLKLSALRPQPNITSPAGSPRHPSKAANSILSPGAKKQPSVPNVANNNNLISVNPPPSPTTEMAPLPTASRAVSQTPTPPPPSSVSKGAMASSTLAAGRSQLDKTLIAAELDTNVSPFYDPFYSATEANEHVDGASQLMAMSESFVTVGDEIFGHTAADWSDPEFMSPLPGEAAGDVFSTAMDLKDATRVDGGVAMNVDNRKSLGIVDEDIDSTASIKQQNAKVTNNNLVDGPSMNVVQGGGGGSVIIKVGEDFHSDCASSIHSDNDCDDGEPANLKIHTNASVVKRVGRRAQQHQSQHTGPAAQPFGVGLHAPHPSASPLHTSARNTLSDSMAAEIASEIRNESNGDRHHQHTNNNNNNTQHPKPNDSGLNKMSSSAFNHSVFNQSVSGNLPPPPIRITTVPHNSLNNEPNSTSAVGGRSAESQFLSATPAIAKIKSQQQQQHNRSNNSYVDDSSKIKNVDEQKVDCFSRVFGCGRNKEVDGLEIQRGRMLVKPSGLPGVHHLSKGN